MIGTSAVSTEGASMKVYSFGSNEDGQCGVKRGQERDGSFSQTKLLLPTLLHFNPRLPICSVSAGSRHTLALSSTGKVFSWGWGLLGQLGHGNTNTLDVPTLIETLSGIAEISAGGMHSGAIDAHGQCFTFGSSNYGQLGLGPEAMAHQSIKQPHQVIFNMPTVCRRISCGGMHTAIIDSYGNLHTFGRADSGQTGVSMWFLRYNAGLPSPMKVALGAPAIDVACGGFHTLVLTSSGVVFVMGAEKPTAVEFFVKRGIGVAAIKAGGWHSCFISREGRLYTCGKGEYGRLGTGDETSKIEPTLVEVPVPRSVDDDPKPATVQDVFPGGSHTLWIDSNGSAFVVGRTDYGRLGIDAREHNVKDRICRPVQLDPALWEGGRVVSAASGGCHSLLLVDDI